MKKIKHIASTVLFLIGFLFIHLSDVMSEGAQE
jgi:hypothetical protein